MSKAPNVKDVPKSSWHTVYESDKVLVTSALVYIRQYSMPDSTAGYEIVPDKSYGSFPTEFWKVQNLTEASNPQVFFGESAWMNARRVAADIDLGAWSI